MPFQDFAPFFGPDELEAMTAAYNGAWYQLWLAGIAVTLHPDAVRKKLAQVILAAACTGKREQKRLEAIAIKALSPTPVQRAARRAPHRSKCPRDSY